MQELETKKCIPIKHVRVENKPKVDSIDRCFVSNPIMGYAKNFEHGFGNSSDISELTECGSALRVEGSRYATDAIGTTKGGYGLHGFLNLGSLSQNNTMLHEVEKNTNLL